MLYHDDIGNIIASQGVNVEPPFDLRESSKYPGRWYFFNTKTKTSHWTLPPSTLGLPAALPKSPEKKSRRGEDDAGTAGGIFPPIQASAHGDTPLARGALHFQSTRTTPTPVFSPPSSSLSSADGMPVFNNSDLGERQAMLTAGSFISNGSNSSFGSMTSGIPSGVPQNMNDSGAQEDITDVSKVPYVVTGGLGAGGYACVMRVEHRESREPFAMKVHSKAALRKSKDRQRLARELRIMIDMPACPFLLHCHAAFETETDVFFVLDLIEGGDLFYHLATHMQIQANP
mmetsp:Transcript_56221/g.127644  ORF Transcript_56221/g.127644 Transcript_56221/m.127644 type:complete len:287 (-) Transcript_56221:374-1234(-)